MIAWGIIWGALLGLAIGRFDVEWLLFGALFGALAGGTLRRAVRSEWRRLADEISAPAVEQTPPTAPITAHATADVAPTPANVSTEAPPLAAPDALAQVIAAPDLSDRSPLVPNVAADTNDPMADRPSDLGPDYARQPDPIERALTRARNWLFGGNTVARVGALVLFIGLAFLAKWAAEQALFPPEMRLASVGVVGIALLVQGFRLSRRQPKATADGEPGRGGPEYGNLLQGVGVATLYLTLFAAFKLYALLPALPAFVLMVLVCTLSTLLAVLSDRQSLAVVGFAGAFATPILLATGEGNHVALFGYYLLLNAAIAIVAWFKAWRVLNMLGFIATFGVATLWGALKYTPDHYASTQPFLLALFLLYVAIGLSFALRHGGDGRRVLDGIVLFGTPIVSFLLQTQLVEPFDYGAALSAVSMSTIYLLLALFVRNRREPVARWLTLAYAALALVFATLAVPLAVDARLTAAIWAIEGAAVFWLATRQRRLVGQSFGAAMQFVAAWGFFADVGRSATTELPALAFANASFVGYMMLALGALLISWWSNTALRNHPTPDLAPAAPPGNDPERTLWRAAHALLFVAGFAWLVAGFWGESTRLPGSPPEHVRLAYSALCLLALALAAKWFWRHHAWAAARYPAFVTAPLLWLFVLGGALFSHSGLVFNAIVWPLCLVMHLVVLRGADDEAPQFWWRAVHIGGVVIGLTIIGVLLDRAIDLGRLRGTDWAAGIVLAAGTLSLLALCLRSVWRPNPTTWPLARFQRQYAVHAGGAIALMTLLGAVIVAVTARGNAAPLPYVPLLNPVDLLVALALAACMLWWQRARHSNLVRDGSWLRGRVPGSALGIATFVALNTVWLRVAHHWRGIAWDAGALAESFFVQAGYSVLWTVLGVLAMATAHRRRQRLLWQIGAALLALTVCKLLLIDLANSGGGERIVAFIAVGALMVAVGYFAPMPPTATPQTTQTEESPHVAS